MGCVRAGLRATASAVLGLVSSWSGVCWLGCAVAWAAGPVGRTVQTITAQELVGVINDVVL